jgi:hypothetical protein
MAARRIAPPAAFVAALVWTVGLFSAAQASVVPSNNAPFWFGIVDGALGIFLVPIVLTLASGRAERLAGLLVAAGMAITGTMVVLAAGGSFGSDAPPWVATAALVALLTLFAYIGVTSCRRRERRERGRVVFALGLLNFAAIPACIFASWSPYTHTNATLGLDGFIALFVVVPLPAWLIAVSLRLYGSAPQTSHPS